MSNTERHCRFVDGPKPLSFHHLLEIHKDRRPDAVAIAGLATPPVSFRRLLLRAEHTAKTLNALGIGRNDRVAMVTPNGPEMALTFLAVSSAATVLENVEKAREDTSGDNRLVAYVISRNKASVTISALRDFLKEKLPDYMMPSQFVFLDSLPLTPNRKLDRAALPRPDQTRPELIVTFVAPRTSVEELLAELWAAVLNLERVGIHDNFFDRSGYSLLATPIVSRIARAS